MATKKPARQKAGNQPPKNLPAAGKAKPAKKAVKKTMQKSQQNL